MKFIWVIALLCLTPTVIAGNLEEVEDLVGSHHFTQYWEEDVFDCADMASANWQFFKDHGYDPKIVVRTDPGPGDHCYIIIPVGEGLLVGLDTSIRMGANLSKNLGAIKKWELIYAGVGFEFCDDGCPLEYAGYDRCESGPYLDWY